MTWSLGNGFRETATERHHMDMDLWGNLALLPHGAVKRTLWNDVSNQFTHYLFNKDLVLTTGNG